MQQHIATNPTIPSDNAELLKAIESNVRSIIAATITKTEIETLKLQLAAAKQRELDLSLLNEEYKHKKSNKEGTVLHFAVASGNIMLIKLLIESGADINATNTSNETPIRLAAKSLTTQELNFLIGFIKAKKLFPTDNKTNNWAEIASEKIEKTFQDTMLFAKLAKTATNDIRRNAYNEKINFEGLTADLESAKKLGLNLSFLNRKFRKTEYTQADDTLLHLAAESGNIDLMKLLIENGADINATNTLKETPIHLAASSLDLVKLESLIGFIKDKGLPVSNYKTSETRFTTSKLWTDIVVEKIEKTFLETMIFAKLAKTTTNDIRRNAYNEKINFEGLTADLESANKLGLNLSFLNRKFRKTEYTQADDTLLHLAAESGNIDLMKLLIENGADINATNTLKETPIHLAASSLDLVKLESLIGFIKDKGLPVSNYKTSETRFTTSKLWTDIAVEKIESTLKETVFSAKLGHAINLDTIKLQLTSAKKLGLDLSFIKNPKYTIRGSNKDSSLLDFAAESKNKDLIQLLTEANQPQKEKEKTLPDAYAGYGNTMVGNMARMNLGDTPSSSNTYPKSSSSNNPNNNSSSSSSYTPRKYQ